MYQDYIESHVLCKSLSRSIWDVLGPYASCHKSREIKVIFKFQMDSTLESTANCHRNCMRTMHSIAERATAVTACAPGRGSHFEMTPLLTNFIFESSFRLNKSQIENSILLWVVLNFLNRKRVSYIVHAWHLEKLHLTTATDGSLQ